MLLAPTTNDLATFTGRPATSIGAFATQALAQATLMFTITTGLSDYPDDPDLKQLATYAILELADRLLLEQPYQLINNSPFQTETIGSYSYSRVTATTTKISSGMKTGLWWWDLAIDKLTVAGQANTAHGSVFIGPDGLRYDPASETWSMVDPREDTDNGGVPYLRIS